MLNRIHIKDFCCFDSVTLDLKKQGLVWVSGINNDTPAATSNGSGKSSLFKALSWVLYGETIDGTKGDGVIKEGTLSAKVTLDMDGAWKIRRVRNKGVTTIDLGKQGSLVDGDKKSIQRKINELIGLDFHAFKNTVLFGQNDTARFASPHVKDSERKDMLHKILRTGILKKCHKIVSDMRLNEKVVARTFQAALDGVKRSFEATEKEIGDIKILENAWERGKESKIVVEIASAKECKEKAIIVTKERASAEDLLGEKNELCILVEKANKDLIEYNKESKELGEISVKLAKFESLLGTENQRLLAAKNDLKGLKRKLCPLCGSKLLRTSQEYIQSIKVVKTKIEKCEEERDSASRSYKKWFVSHKEQAKLVKAPMPPPAALEAFNRRIHSLQKEIDETRTKKERVKSLVIQAKRHINRAKELQGEENPHIQYAIAAMEKRREKKEGKERLQKEYSACLQKQSVLDFWTKGFSNQGIPSFILDAIVGTITERTNFYLEILSDGDIEMQFDTQRELKASKGEYREELNIQWTIEGARNHAPSGGQQRKMEIATDLALMDLAEMREGARLDIFIADEILDGLDAEGTDRVIRLLQDIRRRRGSVFVISHQSDMGEVFERSVSVVKEGGSSRLESS